MIEINNFPGGKKIAKDERWKSSNDRERKKFMEI